MNIVPNEKEIVERLVLGDKDAFCELYTSYKGVVIRFSMRMIKSGTIAEDVFQDTFAMVWQSRRFINPGLSFSAYLFTIVKNRILNILREEDNQWTLKSVMSSKQKEEEQTTHETILLNDLMRLIREAKQTLTPKQLQIYELSREQNMSHAEIAETLEISKNTVREHITMSLKQIRNYLDKHGDYLELMIYLGLLNV